ncbi:receptor-like serine/threonine-protein kinase ALE2 isoform X9 [Solanum lycopersicum]|uniref:receptor-like serine/threonine-protein kinase ALE2 isoform X9 n=1 Tax=Solanum lycopersicum TaxID=4081 RepID=UPI000532A833|nr:receptor-like serine/threonine-protein kinase ALE2 isoform X2 [Solanum lycopersicum]
MGGVKLQLVCLLLQLCAFAFSMGSAGVRLSPSPSASSAVHPVEEGIPFFVSHGNASTSNAPAPALELNVASPPANVFPPMMSPTIPKPIEVLTPSLQPSAPIILPPPSSAPPTINSAPPQIASLPGPPPPIVWSDPAPVLPPSAPKRDHRHTEQPVVVPEAPAPVSSPGRNSTEDAPTKTPPLPGSMPPSESRSPEGPLSSIAPVLNAPSPRGMPRNSLPTLPRNPEISPSIPPVLNAPSPRGKPQNPLPTHPIIPEVSPSMPPATFAPPPRKLPNNSPPSHPRHPLKPPSISPVKHNISPVSIPWPSINRKRASAPTVAPTKGMNHQHPAKGLPPSPPSAASDIDTISSQPYPGDNNGRTIQPLGVDVRGQQHKSGPSRSVIAVIVLSASVAVILCCAVAWVLLFRHRDHGYQLEPTPPTTLPSLAKSSGIAASMIGSRLNSPTLSFSSSFAAYTGSARTFSSKEIDRATDSFNEARVLGEGGFGRVYSGVLDDGVKVAVKVLKRDDQQGGREFLAEVEMLSRLHHRNLVKLIGICLEERSRCLLYELIPNGSVESHLHGVDKESSPLDWDARMKIALGAARGLAYLHEDSSPRVIHRDFKSSNILLEHDFTPKVSDFGLARAALDEGERHISTRVMGTFGYVAPEYAMTGHLLVKSDVYSYGVVLLELLTGKKPVDMSQPPGQENLVAWARPLLTSEEGLELIMDRNLGPDFPFDDIVKVAAIASMCVQPEVSHRPFMGEVVQALKLVCNECGQTKDVVSQSCSQDDLSIDMDAGVSTTSSQVLNPIQPQSPVSNSDSELDVERGLSMSDLLSPLARYGQQESGSFRRYSSSGPLRKGKTRRLWQKMRRLSGGSLSEHGVMFGLRPGSH